MKGDNRGIELIPIKEIQNSILLMRGQKVMADRDLALLYGVTTSNLNKAVDRNIDRFPLDFMFRLDEDEFENLKFHFGISRWGGTRKLPRVFTEQGIAMLASVLRSKRAIMVNILIMRIFVYLRQSVVANEKISRKLLELENRVAGHDNDIKALVAAIKQLMIPPKKFGRQIGFKH